MLWYVKIDRILKMSETYERLSVSESQVDESDQYVEDDGTDLIPHGEEVALLEQSNETNRMEFFESSFSEHTPIREEDSAGKMKINAAFIQNQPSEAVSSNGFFGKVVHYISSISRNGITLLLVVALLTILVWQLPADVGNYIVYPFSIFATFCHEMGHATTALLCGDTVQYVMIESNGNGLTVYKEYNRGLVCNALISVNGPLGPTFIGCLIICMSVLFVKYEKFSRILLAIIGALVLVCTAVLVRKSIFGMVFLPIFSIIILLVSYLANGPFVAFSLQWIGVQMAISMYENLWYLFTDLDGKSDTGAVTVLFHGLIPHYVVAYFIIVINIIFISSSLLFVYKTSKMQQDSNSSPV